MELDAAAARTAFEEGPAGALGMSVEEASMGAVQILTHSMVQSIEENSVRKGYDPRDFALVAEGGAGPLFAAQIALEVGTPWVVVPNYPGVTAALGLLATDMVYEYVSTVYERLSKLDAAALQRAFEELEEQARVQLEEDGVAAEQILIQRVADCRYLGQGYELRVDVDSGPIDHDWVEKVRRRLPRHPRARVLAPLRGVGHRDPERPRPRDRADAAAEGAGGRARRPVAGRRAALRARCLVPRRRRALEQVATRFYDRAALKAGNRLEGPAIVNQYDSTTVIPPGLTARVDRFGNIVIGTGVAAEAEAVTAAEVSR